MWCVESSTASQQCDRVHSHTSVLLKIWGLYFSMSARLIQCTLLSYFHGWTLLLLYRPYCYCYHHAHWFKHILWELVGGFQRYGAWYLITTRVMWYAVVGWRRSPTCGNSVKVPVRWCRLPPETLQQWGGCIEMVAVPFWVLGMHLHMQSERQCGQVCVQ